MLPCHGSKSSKILLWTVKWGKCSAGTSLPFRHPMRNTWANPANLNAFWSGYFWALRAWAAEKARHVLGSCSLRLPAWASFLLRLPFARLQRPSLPSLGASPLPAAGALSGRNNARPSHRPSPPRRGVGPDKSGCSFQVNFILKVLQNYGRAILRSWLKSRLFPCDNYTATFLSFTWQTLF